MDDEQLDLMSNWGGDAADLGEAEGARGRRGVLGVLGATVSFVGTMVK